MRRPILRLLACSALLLAAASLPAARAGAHPLAPSLLELREQPGGKVLVRWKTSAYRPTGAHLEPELPAWCTGTGSETASDAPGYRQRRFVLDCGARGLRDATIGVEDLDASRTVALLRVELADGRRMRALLDGARPRFTIPERESRLAVARDYFELGAEHLATGLDHLLFVLCLCLLVAERRALVWTITAFTLGHSVTLTLATLGFVRFPQAIAETAIALSIVLLAAEILRAEDDRLHGEEHPSWIRQHPWAVAFSFGLLHGLGFAGALAEVGLPDDEIPIALLTFNLGIEVGQLAFVALLLVLATLARPLLARLPRGAVRVPAYAMGSLAAFWSFSRGAAALGLLPLS